MQSVILLILLFSLPVTALAAEASAPSHVLAAAPLSALWILANFSYAGMRAQASNKHEWRAVSFVGGFPGTLVSMAAIGEGSQRIYGVDIPRRNNH